MLLRLKEIVANGILQIGYWPSEPMDNTLCYWSSTKDDKWGAYCLVNSPYSHLGLTRLCNHNLIIPCLR